MKLFEDVILELRAWMEEMKRSSQRYAEHAAAPVFWPAGERGNIVMQSDTAVELGNPRDESASFLVWTADAPNVRDGTVTIIGPDVDEGAAARLPFGKAVILGVKGFTEDNCHERHREIELLRFDLNLRGYMMRAASQYLKEWSRISREAVAGGFSLDVLARSLMDLYRKTDYVSAAEIVFVTGSPESVRSLQRIGERAARLIGAMNKMAGELSFDCGTCDFTDVCGEVDALKSMRDAMMKGADNG